MEETPASAMGGGDVLARQTSSPMTMWISPE
jgi:hypothetical protein